MNNLEFYKDEIINSSITEVFIKYTRRVQHNNRELIEWLCVEHEILDEKEKKYLTNVIKPYRNRIYSIKKCAYQGFIEYICIYVYDDLNSKVECVTLPNFKKGCMYKGMELCKAYTLEELGL